MKRPEITIANPTLSWVRAPVAQALLGGISRTTLYERKAEGVVETRKIGGVRLFGVESINRLIESGTPVTG
jgi:hypothetical protein